ncbi:hypothetical protein ACOMHN_029716 [Nucella lapillus]
MGDRVQQTVLENGSAQQSGKRPQNGIDDKKGGTTIIFSLPEKVGALANVLKLFEKHQVNLQHIESRPSRDKKDCYEFFVTCGRAEVELEQVTDDLKDHTLHLQLLGLPGKPTERKNEVPWIPRTVQDLDLIDKQLVHIGLGLDEDHPHSPKPNP